MKISRQQLRRIIQEEIYESSSKYSTPDTGEGSESPILNAKNKIAAAITALSFLASETNLPILNLERTLYDLKKINRVLKKEGDL